MTKTQKTNFWLAIIEASNIDGMLQHDIFLVLLRGRHMDIHLITKDILGRASLIELRDAIRTATKFGDAASANMFRAEIGRRLDVDGGGV